MMKVLKTVLVFFLLQLPCTSQTQQAKQCANAIKSTVWTVADLLYNPHAYLANSIGKPQIIHSKYGKAVYFDGKSDGLFLKKMPLKNLTQFTVETIFRPDSGGLFEQRFFHCGEINGSRVMLELRSTKKGWYFDAHLNSHGTKKTLIDSTKVHSSNQWYHVAFVVNNGLLTTYINGKPELSDSTQLSPFSEGITSIGVRQNRVSWFKGAVYKIIITPHILLPENFHRH